MFEKIFKPEDKRRSLNLDFDISPTYIHKFNFEFSKKFIKNKKVLDIGCWTGQFEQLAYKISKKMIGIDPKVEAIEFARKRLPEVNFIVAKADKLPFSNSYFDTILLMDVLEHLPKRSEMSALNEISRVIKPGGTLIISTPNKHILSILLDPAYFLIGHRHYSKKEISKILTEASFEIKEIRLVGNSSGLIYAIISLFFKYTLGFEPKYLQRAKEFLLKEHSKEGFAFLFVVAEAIK